jgi:hypothetical protein
MITILEKSVCFFVTLIVKTKYKSSESVPDLTKSFLAIASNNRISPGFITIFLIQNLICFFLSATIAALYLVQRLLFFIYKQYE